MKTNWRSGATLIWLMATLLLAMGLRAYRLDAQSLWYDEAVTAQVAGWGVAELTRWTAEDIQPPLYYYVAAGWTRLTGRSEWALRFPSAFCGVLTVALLWAVGRRLFGRGNTWAAGLVALLAALSSLYVYYSQEARMYSLLTFLGALAGYALLRTTGDKSRKWWAAFVLAGTAMLYTHYFGAFLLAAYGICWLTWLGTAGHAGKRAQLAAFAVSVVAITVFYLPWLPAMLNRYQTDASYWQGQLKWDEALRHVALSFTTGAPETMLEPAAVRLLPFHFAVLAIAGAALVWRQRRAPLVAMLAVIVAFPIAAILLLTLRMPKFNPRYLMLASPAYLLLLAGGIAALCGEARLRALRDIFPPLALSAFLLGTSLSAVYNWFADPAFTKAQWRELAAYVRRERAADEAVLLVSGHAYPAWDYYAPDIPLVRLPEIEILDVNAVLDFSVGAQLAVALAGKGGAWLVGWQDEVVDPVGVVPYLLTRAGAEQPVAGSFWHLKLRHWQLRPDAAFPAEPQPQHLQGANFDHKLALVGWDDPAEGQITVYWRVLNTLTQDYQVAVVVEDAAGNRVGQWDGRPAGYHYPAFRWRPGQVLLGRYPLPVPPAVAGGSYTLALTVYSAADPTGLDIRDVADNPAGKQVRLGPVWIGD
ncbi:MAG: glycosyltransferase family 39 protein [Anaerolineae bacterium]